MVRYIFAGKKAHEIAILEKFCRAPSSNTSRHGLTRGSRGGIITFNLTKKIGAHEGRKGANGEGHEDDAHRFSQPTTKMFPLGGRFYAD